MPMSEIMMKSRGRADAHSSMEVAYQGVPINELETRRA